LKAIIEEKEVPSAVPAAPSAPATRFNPIPLEPKRRSSVQPKEDAGYPSCLDLAAEFIARG